MVTGHYKKRQGQTINIPTDQNLATLVNYPKCLETREYCIPNPNWSSLHSKMSYTYSKGVSLVKGASAQRRHQNILWHFWMVTWCLTGIMLCWYWWHCDKYELSHTRMLQNFLIQSSSFVHFLEFSLIRRHNDGISKRLTTLWIWFRIGVLQNGEKLKNKITVIPIFIFRLIQKSDIGSITRQKSLLSKMPTYSNAHAKVQNWIFDALFPGNRSEFSII